MGISLARLLLPLTLFAGATLVSVGVWMIYEPAAFVVLGTLLLAAGLEASR